MSNNVADESLLTTRFMLCVVRNNNQQRPLQSRLNMALEQAKLGQTWEAWREAIARRFHTAAILTAMGAVGVVSAAGLEVTVGSPAQAAEPTPIALPVGPSALPYKIVQLNRDDCRGLASLATMHLQAEKPKALSAAFIDSLTFFVTPDKQSLTCDGTREGNSAPVIVVKTTRDLAVWKGIEDSGRRQHIDAAHAVNVLPDPGGDAVLPAALQARAKALAEGAKLSQR